MADDLTWLPAWQIGELVANREVTAVEVAEHFLARVATKDQELHSFLTVAAESALREAASVDRAVQSGETVGPLAGVPLGVKDQFATAGLRTTSGSLLFADHVPTEDAVFIERVRDAGAVILGKTNTPEFGLFWRTWNRLGPECLNPWDTQRTSGGSSGGAAASVVGGLVPAGLGSDRGGSIRIPSAFCGAVGVLPSAGRVPNHGGVGRALWFRGVGPVVRNVRDAALLLQTIAGGDDRDPQSSWTEVPHYTTELQRRDVGRVRLGFWRDSEDGVDHDSRVIEQVARTVQELDSLVESVTEVALPDMSIAKEVFWTLNDAERWAMFAESIYTDPAKRGLLCPYVLERLESGRGTSAAEVLRAMYSWQELRRKMDLLFTRVDAIVSPTVGRVAPRVDASPERHSVTSFTYVANFYGVCAATIPCGLVDGMPVGLQIIAPPGAETLLLELSQIVEDITSPSIPRQPTLHTV